MLALPMQSLYRITDKIWKVSTIHFGADLLNSPKRYRKRVQLLASDAAHSLQSPNTFHFSILRFRIPYNKHSFPLIDDPAHEYLPYQKSFFRFLPLQTFCLVDSNLRANMMTRRMMLFIVTGVAAAVFDCFDRKWVWLWVWPIYARLMGN